MGLISQIVTHYKILEKLGEGGMAIVFKAEDLKLKRTVALKLLTESFTQDEESKKRFINEAQAASALQHNNICTIHDIDETPDGQIFIAMDYYEGKTLKDKISQGSLSIDETINFTTQIAEGLSKAHKNNIIHRDVKAANIFITNEGIVKILDFGLAKKLDRTQITRIGTKIGTTDYMSPEQIKGEKVDQRTDIWSLGVLLYEMLAGRLPFQADYEQAILYLILNQEPEDVKKFRNDIPNKLLSILEKTLVKERDDRYASMELLLEDLKHITNGTEIQTSKFELQSSISSQSIVVLPFVNLSTDQEQESFCDGLTEELITALSSIRDLRVVARTSAFAFKAGSYDIRKIGRKLDVRTVLEGSVRKSGDKCRITVQLINVLDGCHLWSESFDREMKDVFQIQEEISLSIVNVLKVKLPEFEKEKLFKRYTDNIEAYNLYQQGFFTFNQLNFLLTTKAIDYFNQALKLDPNYALAYFGLGMCLFIESYYGFKRSKENKDELNKCISKIIEIDNSLSEGYTLLGLYDTCFAWNQIEADSAYRHSVELDPNNVNALRNYSLNRNAAGQFDHARLLSKRAKAIDPLSDYTNICVIFPDFYTGNFNAALERLNKYSEINLPFVWGMWFLFRTLSLMNRKAEAAEMCRKTFSILGGSEVAKVIEKANINNTIEATARTMAELYKVRYNSPYLISILFAHAGKQKEAFYWMEIAIEEVDPQICFLNVDPEWQSIRNDIRFKYFVNKIGFGKNNE